MIRNRYNRIPHPAPNTKMGKGHVQLRLHEKKNNTSETAIKKARSDNSESRQGLRAKRSCYEGEGTARRVEDITSATERSEINSETNKSGAKRKRRQGRKQKVKESAGQTIVTSTAVDAELSNMDTRGLLMTLTSQVQQNVNTMSRRMESLETNLEKTTLTDKMNKRIDKRINSETKNVKGETDKSVSDLRNEFDSDIEDLTEKINHVASQIEHNRTAVSNTGKVISS